MTDKLKNHEVVQPVYMRAKEAAAYLGISRRHFASLVSNGLFASYPVGPRCILFSRSDLDAGLAGLRRPALNEAKR